MEYTTGNQPQPVYRQQFSTQSANCKFIGGHSIRPGFYLIKAHL